MNKSELILNLLEDMFKYDTSPQTEEDLRGEADDHLDSFKGIQRDYKVDAIKAYNHKGDYHMNNFLRHGTEYKVENHYNHHNPEDGPEEPPFMDHGHMVHHVKDMKEVTNHPTQHSFKAYRGMVGTDMSHLKEGDTFKDKGFTSTSTNPETGLVSGTRNFKSKQGQPAVNFRIHITPGTKGHFISAHDYSLKLEHRGEDEFVLHPGTTFKVLGKSSYKSHYDNGAEHHFIDLGIHSQED